MQCIPCFMNSYGSGVCILVFLLIYGLFIACDYLKIFININTLVDYMMYFLNICLKFYIIQENNIILDICFQNLFFKLNPY